MTQCQCSRRGFFKTSTTIAGALAASPYFFSASAANAQESKNDRVCMGAIGVGGRGTDIGVHASQVANVVACADVHLGNAQAFKRYMGDKGTVYQDYRKLLDRQDVEAVTIGTPDHWHVKIAIDAMKAGKHVYCEKPLTLTLDEGVLICQAAEKYQKTFQVGTQQRSEFRGDFLKAVAIARSGRLGNKLHAISSVGAAASRSPDKSQPFGPFPTTDPPAQLDWDMWLGQAPAVSFCPQRIGWNFRWWFEYSGGQVTDWGVHHTDIAFWALAGNDGQVVEATPKSCSFMAVPRQQTLDFLLGKVAAKDMPPAYNVASEFDVELKLSTGNTIELVSGPNQLLISGEKGRIRVNRDRLTGKPVEEINADPRAKEEIERLMAEIYGGSLPSPNVGHMSNFLACIRSGKQPVANVRDHIRSVNACHLANIALLVGRKVQWDPAQGQFIADDEANALRQRKQREPYGISV